MSGSILLILPNSIIKTCEDVCWRGIQRWFIAAVLLFRENESIWTARALPTLPWSIAKKSWELAVTLELPIWRFVGKDLIESRAVITTGSKIIYLLCGQPTQAFPKFSDPKLSDRRAAVPRLLPVPSTTGTGSVPRLSPIPPQSPLVLWSHQSTKQMRWLRR